MVVSLATKQRLPIANIKLPIDGVKIAVAIAVAEVKHTTAI